MNYLGWSASRRWPVFIVYASSLSILDRHDLVNSVVAHHCPVWISCRGHVVSSTLPKVSVGCEEDRVNNGPAHTDLLLYLPILSRRIPFPGTALGGSQYASPDPFLVTTSRARWWLAGTRILKHLISISRITARQYQVWPTVTLVGLSGERHRTRAW